MAKSHPSRPDVALMPDASGNKTNRKAKGKRGQQQNGTSAQPVSQAANSSLSRSLFDVLQFLTSLVLRLGVYIFLRWIPTSLAWPVLPAAYGTYVLVWLIKDRSVRRLIRSWENASAASDLQQIAADVKVSEPAIGEQVGNSHKAEGVSAITSSHLAQKPSSSLLGKIGALVTGLSVASKRTNLLNLALHTLVFAFFIDSYASPYLFPSHYEHNLIFHRVADIGPTHAKVHLRWPEPIPLFEGLQEDVQGSGVLRDGMQRVEKPFRLVYREIVSPSEGSRSLLGGSNRWERGPLISLDPETDWTSSVTLNNLWPNTEYEYRLAWGHNNTFVSPHRLIEFEQTFTFSLNNDDADSLLSGSERNFVGGKFRTWPDPRTGQGLGGLSVATALDVEDEDGELVPVDDPNHFKFVTSSCVKPAFPYSPSQFSLWSWLLQLLPTPSQLAPQLVSNSSVAAKLSGETDPWARRNRIIGFDLMYERYIRGKKEPNVKFFLQLGDLIYADVPRFAGAVLSGYRKLYRNLFASPSFRRVYEAIPMIGIYDDHEVKNNWSGLDEDDAVIKEFPVANSAWKEYVGSANPDSLEHGENYYTFRYGSETAFFVMDTRRHRQPSKGFPLDGEDEDQMYEPISGQPYKTMLGQQQKDALFRWLGAVNSTATFKFIVSSVPFMSLWGGPWDVDGKKDSWAAYLAERETLIEVMQYVPNVIILSGDRHEFAATGLRALSSERPEMWPVTEFSTSPLNMFYLPVRTLSQEHGRGPTGQEKLLKYVPDGNFKWSEFEVDTRRSTDPKVTLRLFVDGEVAWKVTLLGKPVRAEVRTIGGLAKSFLELLGWRSRKWF